MTEEVQEELKPKRRRRMTQEEMDAEIAATRAEAEQRGTYVSPLRQEPPPADPAAISAGTLEEPPLEADLLADEDYAQLRRDAEEVFGDMLVPHAPRGRIAAPAGADTLVPKLVRVMAAIDGIEKRGENRAQGYAYQRAVDVAKIVRNEFIKEGLFLVTSITDLNSTIIPRGANQAPTILAEIKGTFLITDGTQSFSFDGVGVGQDVGDKGVYKAITGMLKYGLRTLLLIPDEKDDPEVTRNDELPAGPENPVIEPASPTGVRQGGRQSVATSAQINKIKERSAELELTPEALAEICKATLGRGPDLGEEAPVRVRQQTLLDFLGGLTFEECGQIVQVLVAAESPVVE